MRSTKWMFGLAAAATLVLGGCAADSESESDLGGSSGATKSSPTESDAAGDVAAKAALKDAKGKDVGTVTFSEVDGGTEVNAEAQGLKKGFYGFHIHAIGKCEPKSAAPDDPKKTGAFLSASGHLDTDDADHGAHAGDLPSLYITESGKGAMTTTTDGFTPEELLGGDGTAVMVHSGPDNFANIPERYSSEGPDAETLKAGDAGTRMACGVVK